MSVIEGMAKAMCAKTCKRVDCECSPEDMKFYRLEAAAGLDHLANNPTPEMVEAMRARRKELIHAPLDRIYAELITAYLQVAGDPKGCVECGRNYGDKHGFPDLIVPDSVWEQISPRGDEGGLLCPSCICKALAAAGIECEGAFTSGPITSVSPEMLKEVLAADGGQPIAQEAGDGWCYDIENAPTFSKTDEIGRDHVFLLAYVDEKDRKRTSEAGWCEDWPFPRLVRDGQQIETGYAFYRYPTPPGEKGT